MMKSPGGLKVVGFLIFVTDKTTAVLIEIDELLDNVIFIVVVLKSKQVKLLSVQGEDIEHVELVLGIIEDGNYIKTTDEASNAESCLIVNV